MAKALRLFVLSLFIATPPAASGLAASVEEFYKGKTIHFIVGGSAGGGYDTYTRLIARHFSQYVPGKPATVVQNMPGAGMLIAANYIFNSAPRDGTYIGHWSGPLILQHMMGNPAVQFEGRKFGWLGMPTPDSLVCITTDRSGIKTADDWRKAKTRVKLGAIGPGTSGTDDTKILAAAAGFPLQLIEGYKGTADIRVAAETGEVDGTCAFGWQSAKVTWAKALQAGQVHVVLQTTTEPHPELKSVPLAIEYAKTDEGKKLLRIAGELYGKQRLYSLPPQVPEDRVRALQQAFTGTMKNPQFLAEAEKAKLEIDPADGPGIEKMVQSLYAIEPAIINRVKQLLTSK
ncbi:MAG TPA: tripartite tricarboxylate transporter substrate-binding protein [Candidatus Eisenbacteria bacterium]|nr:tripartite tricarboxylate transporter substrate-binding protein [Candidatus Eisenbacteria bacterium]